MLEVSMYTIRKLIPRATFWHKNQVHGVEQTAVIVFLVKPPEIHIFPLND